VSALLALMLMLQDQDSHKNKWFQTKKNHVFLVEMKRLDSGKNERTIWNKKNLSLGFVAASTQAFLFQTFTQL